MNTQPKRIPPVFRRINIPFLLTGCILASCSSNTSSGTTGTFTQTVPQITVTVTSGVLLDPSLTPTLVLPTEVADRLRRQEATRIAVMTAVPQITLGPDFTPPREVFSTPIPEPTNVLHSAGSGMILEDGQAALPSMSGSFTNQWFEQTGNKEIRVYAGCDFHNRSKGLIAVVVTEPGKDREENYYYAPSQLGKLSIVDAVGENLILAAGGSIRFSFDVPTRQWTILTPTPLSSPSPIP